MKGSDIIVEYSKWTPRKSCPLSGSFVSRLDGSGQGYVRSWNPRRSNPAKLRVINELQHSITGRIVDSLAGGPHVDYTDANFWRGIQELSSRSSLSQELESSLVWVLARLEPLSQGDE